MLIVCIGIKYKMLFDKFVMGVKLILLGWKLGGGCLFVVIIFKYFIGICKYVLVMFLVVFVFDLRFIFVYKFLRCFMYVLL